MTKGPIVIVEDDPDDRELYQDVIERLGITNPLRFFDQGIPALAYLSTTMEQPFIILSDINMPLMNGLEFKTRIQQDDYLREKGIPFVFITTNSHAAAVRQAHQLSVQGYFEKPMSITGLKQLLSLLFDYWAQCRHINNT